MPIVRRTNRRLTRRKKKMPLRKLIKKVIISQAEKKFHDLDLVEASLVAASPSTSSLCQIPQGNLVGERIGDSCDLTRLRVRFNLKVIGTNQTPESIRVMVFQQLSEGLIVGIPTFIEDLWPTFNVAIFPYKVLYDRVFDMGLGINSDLVRSISLKNFKKRLSFKDTNDPIMGEIFIRFITDNDTADQLQMRTQTRLYYTDQ